MHLTVKDVATLFSVTEKTIYRWLKKDALPAYRVNNHYRFNRAELLEWATSRQINVSTDIFHETGSEEIPLHALSEALSLGGIYYRVEGRDKETVLRNVVGLMRLPPEVDRNFLLQVLLAREAMAPTAIGNGMAIPHVRNPIVLHVTEPVVCLSFLENPIDFGSLDGKPVNCLFTLVSPTVKAHLHLLSKLAFMLRDEDVGRVLRRQGSREEVLSEIARVESRLQQSQSGRRVGEEY